MRRPDPFETEMFIEDLQAAQAAGMANPQAAMEPAMPPVQQPQIPVATPAPQQIPLPSDPMADAQSARDRMLKYSMLLRGFQDVLKGATGANVNYGTADALAQQAMLPVEDVKLEDQMKRQAAQEKRADKQLGLQEKADVRAEKGEVRAQDKFEQEQKSMSQALEKGQMDLEIARQANDPTSSYSDIAREYATKYLKVDPEKVKNLSAAQLMSVSKPIQELMMAEMRSRAQQRELELKETRIAQADRRLDQQDTKEGRLREQFGYRKVEKFTEDASKAVQDLRKTDSWKTAEKALAEVPTIKNLVQDAVKKGGQSLAMLGPRIAKGIAGEVGVLTEQDVTRYVQNPALVPGLMDTLTKMKSGKLTDTSAENILRLLDIMEKEAQAKVQGATIREAQLFSKRQGIPIEDALYFIDSAYKNPSRVGTETDEYKVEPTKEVPKDYTQPEAQEESVMMISPDGQRAMVKKSQVQKYLDKGATLAK